VKLDSGLEGGGGMKKGIERIDDTRLRVPVGYQPGMNVEGMIYIDRELEGHLEEQAIMQVANVATLPGIVKASLAMTDIHYLLYFPSLPPVPYISLVQYKG